MKQKILEALTTKFSGVDAKILGRIADNLAKTVTSEEDVATAVEGVTFSDVLKSYGDARATEATKSAVSNYEKKHGLKDGKVVVTEKTEEEDEEDEEDTEKEGKEKPKQKKQKESKDDEIPAWAKALTGKMENALAEIAAIKKGKVTDLRKEKLTKALEGLTEKQRKPYGRVAIDTLSDEEFDEFLTEVGEYAEDLKADNQAKESVFTAPLGGNHSKSTKQVSDADLNDIADKIVG